MDNILNYIEQQYIIDSIREDIANYVFESLNCKMLQELAKQLKDQKDDEKEQQSREKYPSHYNKDFKAIFGHYHAVAWDKIKDEDFRRVTFNGDPKNDRAIEKEVRSIIKGDQKSLVLVKDKDDDLFLYVIFTYGETIRLDYKGRNHAGESTGHNTGRKWVDLNQREKLDLLKDKIIYIVDNFKQYDKEREDKRNERYRAQRGIILLDDTSLKAMAAENVKRYKEIIAKNRANRLNNTVLLDECSELIKKASDLAIEVAKDPIKYADVTYDISKLTLYIYDSRRYVAPTRYNKQGYYSGVNGLLPLISKYTDTLKDIQKNGGYEHQRKDLETYQNTLKDSVNKVKELIKNVEEKMEVSK